MHNPLPTKNSSIIYSLAKHRDLFFFSLEQKRVAEAFSITCCYMHTLHEQKRASQSRLLTPHSDFLDPLNRIGLKERGKKKKGKKGTGPTSFSIWVKGHMQWDLKIAESRRGPIDVTYIPIRLKPIFRQGFSCSEGPLC